MTLHRDLVWVWTRTLQPGASRGVGIGIQKCFLGVLSWPCAHISLPLASAMNSDDHGREAGTDVPWGWFVVGRDWQYA